MAATFEYAGVVTATSVAATTTLGINAHYLKLINGGSSTFYFSLNGVTATTSASLDVRTGETFELKMGPHEGYITSFSARTPATNNATIRAFAFGRGISS